MCGPARQHEKRQLRRRHRVPPGVFMTPRRVPWRVHVHVVDAHAARPPRQLARPRILRVTFVFERTTMASTLATTDQSAS